MPRDLPLGNGSLQINFDSAYRIVDCYYPYVGQDNQAMGHPFRVGIWVDGEFAWTDSPEWERELAYKPATLVTQVRLTHRRLGVALGFHDAIDCDRNLFIYMWPRDGALVAEALDRAGYNDVTRAFYQFCASAITREGYFLHKYRPDGSQGSSWHPWALEGKRQFPIQEEETALVLWALWEHFKTYRDVEFIKPLYRPLIMRGANFMLRYRHERTGLPLPSYDLWEECKGILSFTCAAVYGGLLAAAHFSGAFGQDKLAKRYLQAAEAIKAAMETHLFSRQHGRFIRMLTDDPDGESRED